jgi:hypothetical protein
MKVPHGVNRTSRTLASSPPCAQPAQTSSQDSIVRGRERSHGQSPLHIQDPPRSTNPHHTIPHGTISNDPHSTNVDRIPHLAQWKLAVEGLSRAHTPLHIHMITMHPPPTNHPCALAIPLFQRSALAPSHHAASTGHAHRLPPPRLITTPGSAPRTLRTSPILGIRSHAASQQLRTSACAPRHCCTDTVVCRARLFVASRASVVVKMPRARSP